MYGQISGVMFFFHLRVAGRDCAMPERSSFVIVEWLHFE
jgi:hypothetical protein